MAERLIEIYDRLGQAYHDRGHPDVETIMSEYGIVGELDEMDARGISGLGHLSMGVLIGIEWERARRASRESRS